MKLIHKILSIFLSAIVLFSSLSFSVEKHVCMGEITDVSFFKEAENCGMVENDSTEEAQHSQIKKENCCDNIQELIPGNDNERLVVKSLEINKARFIVALILTFENLPCELESKTFYKDASPPFVIDDIYKLDQTYLI